MKHKHQILGYNKYIVYQHKDYFRFTIDSILLAGFVDLKYDTKNIIDLGTGNGVIPIYLTLKTDAHIYGVEIQKELFDLGVKGVKKNKLEEQITLINDDLKNMPSVFKNKEFDAVVCNPPFFKYHKSSHVNKNEYLTIARHEVKTNLNEIIETSYELLKDRGTLFLIHRPDRLTEIIRTLQTNKMEPKIIRFVHPNINKGANHVLIKAIKNAKEGSLKVLKPLYVYDGEELTKEVLNIYNYRRKENVTK